MLPSVPTEGSTGLPALPESTPGWFVRITEGTTRAPMNTAWLGNRRNLGNSKVMLSLSEQRQARRVLGGEGSGRTEVLAAMAKGAIDKGQGLVYLDGTGSLDLIRKIWGFAHWAHRMEDVRILAVGNHVGLPALLEHVHPPGIRPQGVFWTQGNTFNPFEGASVDALKEWLIPELHPDDHDDVGGIPWPTTSALLERWLELMLAGQEGGYGPLDLQRLGEALTAEAIASVAQDALLPSGVRQAFHDAWRLIFGEPPVRSTPASQVWLAALRRRWAELVEVPGWEMPHDPHWVYAGECSWREALGRQHILLVLLPPMEKATPRQRRAARALSRQLLAEAQQWYTPWPAEAPPRAMWVFDAVRHYFSEALARVPTQATAWGVTTLWGDDAHRPDDQGTALEELLLSCPMQVFLREGAADTYLGRRFGDQAPTHSLKDLRPGEAWVALYDKWMPMSMAYQKTPDSPAWLYHPTPLWRRTWWPTPPWQRAEQPHRRTL